MSSTSTTAMIPRRFFLWLRRWRRWDALKKRDSVRAGRVRSSPQLRRDNTKISVLLVGRVDLLISGLRPRGSRSTRSDTRRGSDNIICNLSCACPLPADDAPGVAVLLGPVKGALLRLAAAALPSLHSSLLVWMSSRLQCPHYLQLWPCPPSDATVADPRPELEGVAFLDFMSMW